jgi:glycosyltransferase involved in cell wall biosynthesis
MRVCFLTHYFPPEVGAPQTRIELLARTLAATGLEVTVHTCFPHYPAGAVIAPYRNRPWLVEHRGQVRVVRSAVYPAANRGFARRLADHTSFSISALATAPLSGAADVVVGETPPLFTAAAGALYARRKRAAYVVNVADRWPASAVELGALDNRTAIALASSLERWVYRQADLITAPTERLAADLDAVPEAAGRSRRTWPVIDIGRFDPVRPRTDSIGGPLRVLFAGTVGLAHGLEILVEASRIAGPEVVHTTIAGDGADSARIRGLVSRLGLENVTLPGTVAPERIPGLYAAADAGAVLLRDLPIFRGALPTKMFEVMAAGLPVLLAARGESAQLVERAGAGVVVPPGDPRALADACRLLRDDPPLREELGAAGRRFVESTLGVERGAAEWRERLEEAVAQRARPR